MGNQQSGSLQFCSADQLYTCRGAMDSYKTEINARVGYNISKHILKEPRFQMQRFQNPQQLVASQQQRQEEVVEMTPISPKSFFETPKQEKVIEKGPIRKKRSTFNVYISCLDQEEELGIKKSNVKTNFETEMIDHFKDDLTVFNGLFGNVIVNMNGLVLYTDITGVKHCEDFEQDKIGKIFPMGISYGGLSKSIWFKDGEARDSCFELMTNLNASSLITDHTDEVKKEQVEDDNDNLVVFEGINSRNVIVHAENIVLYTDIKGDKHCVHYNKHNIKKCFPNGIQSGGLTRTIWFNDEMERDLCFMLMQWNVSDEPVEEVEEKSPNRDFEFTGLFGSVLLNADCKIEYTTLQGDRVESFYEPNKIKESFPKGISYGRLPKTIWFQDEHERKRCIDAMRNM